MNGHDVTVAGYLLIASSGVGLEVYARRTARIPTIGTVLSQLMRTRSGRIGVIAAWAWLGMHYFAR